MAVAASVVVKCSVVPGSNPLDHDRSEHKEPPLKKIALSLFVLSLTLAPAAVSQTITTQAPTSGGHPTLAADQPLFFPHNWIRGFTDFGVAPSHNEPDLGRCMFPQPASAGGSASQCTAYARYNR